jgi:beta-lactamase class A
MSAWRWFLRIGLGFVVVGWPLATAGAAGDFAARMAALEAGAGGRLGVAVWNSAEDARSGYRASERFAMCSTFKALLAAAVLARVDAGRESLEREVAYGPADLLDYAPVTKAHVAEGHMTVGALCAAAVELSDNSAANLLLASLGGPKGLTDFLRGQGDAVTRLDRTEPTLNSNEPADPRDTTTPRAMVGTLRKLLLGDGLTPRSREQLLAWMRGCQTGAGKLRAGLPAGWKIGEKTGGGAHGANNDVAILWPPPAGGPILVAVYTSGMKGDAAARNAVIAQVGRAVAEEFGRQ